MSTGSLCESLLHLLGGGAGSITSFRTEIKATLKDSFLLFFISRDTLPDHSRPHPWFHVVSSFTSSALISQLQTPTPTLGWNFYMHVLLLPQIQHENSILLTRTSLPFLLFVVFISTASLSSNDSSWKPWGLLQLLLFPLYF